jgi:hypothetical protein
MERVTAKYSIFEWWPLPPSPSYSTNESEFGLQLIEKGKNEVKRPTDTY